MAVSIKVFYAWYRGIALDEVFSYYTDPNFIDESFLLSSLAIVFFAIGVRLGLGKSISCSKITLDWFRSNTIKPLSVIIFYLFVTVLIEYLWQLRLVIPGLNTAIYALTFFKWGVLGVSSLFFVYKSEKRALFVLIIVFEIILSLSSFFAEFKSYLFVVLIIIGATRKNLFSTKNILISSFVGVVLIQIAILWTAIKGDYREYLSGGTRQQVVSVEKSDALKRINELVSTYDSRSNQVVLDQLVDRLGYIDFFSVALGYVPTYVEHQNGEIFINGITHVLKPRLFFPDKPIIDDSQHLMKYTGLYLAGFEQGTSHSLGYVGDAYIDFGRFWMFLPILIAGFLHGFLCRVLLRNVQNKFWLIALYVPFFFLANRYGAGFTKMFGNLTIYFLVATILKRYAFPRLETLFLRNTKIQKLNQ